MKTKRVLLAMFFALVANAMADGFIVVKPPTGNEGAYVVPRGHFSFAPLGVNYHRVHVDIDGMVATTTVDQEFYNPNGVRLEGTYLFPVPTGAHIDRFSMEIDGKAMEAELLSADKAKAIYEGIVRQMKDPALLEYIGKDAFQLRVYPIEPRSTKRVKIVYKQWLKESAGLVDYTYPLNTEKYSSTLIKQVEVKVSIHGEVPLKAVYCGTHEVVIKRESDVSAVVEYRAQDERPDRDLRIDFSRKKEVVGIDLMCARQAGSEEGHFVMVASPGRVENKQVQAKDICFVLDTSGSMAGKKLEKAKSALNLCLANLNPEDRFEVVRFSTEVEPVFDQLKEVKPETIQQAKKAIDRFKPIGGTAIQEALSKALELQSADRNRPYLVVFLTDGIPTVGEVREDALVGLVKNKNQAATRIFSFGIGHDVNVHLLDRIADETRAASQYVSEQEDLEVKLSQFYQKIKDPVFCRVRIEVLGNDVKVSEMLPNPLPDLFQGDQLVLMGKYRGQGKVKVRVSGVWNGEESSFESELDFKAESMNHDSIAQLWATRRVGWLLDQIRMNGESQELKDEVTQLARRYGIVTPYTAYLIQEDEIKRGVPVAYQNMSEMSRDTRVLNAAKAKMDSLKLESKAEQARAGKEAVGNSVEIKRMQGQGFGGGGMGGGGPVFGLTMAKGQVGPAVPSAEQGYRQQLAQNYMTQAKVVNGRSFYQNGEVWVDSTAQAQPGLKQVKVEFNSDAYFALMTKHEGMHQWLSLGNNMDVVVGGNLYQIRDH